MARSFDRVDRSEAERCIKRAGYSNVKRPSVLRSRGASPAQLMSGTSRIAPTSTSVLGLGLDAAAQLEPVRTALDAAVELQRAISLAEAGDAGARQVGHAVDAELVAPE